MAPSFEENSRQALISESGSSLFLLGSTPSSSSSSPSKQFSVQETIKKGRGQEAEIQRLAQEVVKGISEFIQTTATFQLSSFGPTGLVTLDILSKAGLLSEIPIVFIDTLYHFDETYDLVERVKRHYPEIQLHIYKPKGLDTREEFEKKFGTELWARMPSKFAYYTKVEPRDRAMADLNCAAYINGRRKSQGSKRETLTFLDLDPEQNITRVQPLFNWTFEQVWLYIAENDVPYNSLHDAGYKSVGDFMTTVAVGDDQDERSGRWKGTNQTECGLHLSPSELATLTVEAH